MRETAERIAIEITGIGIGNDETFAKVSKRIYFIQVDGSRTFHTPQSM
jgi:hypothetical protein